MARIFIDGFESGGEKLWDGSYDASAVSSTGKDMDGDYCLDLNDSNSYVQKNFVATDEMYFSFLYRPMTIMAEQILTTYKGGVGRLLFVRDKSNENRIRIDDEYNAITSGTTILNEETTYRIEIHLKIANSGGRIEVKIDGTQDIDFTGDTQVGSDTQLDMIKLGISIVSGYTSYAYFDNFIMDDSSWIGNTNIQAVKPTGAGNTTGWTPSAGNNWDCVDEVPPVDTDYVSINAVDTTDTYVAGDMVGTISSVKCVQVQARVISDGAPTPTNLKMVVRSGGTDYLGGDNVVPSVVKSFSKLWETNPADSAAWEESDVNAMEIGIRSAA